MQNSFRIRVLDVCRGIFTGITLAGIAVYAYMPIYTKSVRDTERLAYIEEETQRFNQFVQEKLDGYSLSPIEPGP